MKKRIISLLLVLAMMVGIVPVFAVLTSAATTLMITQPQNNEWISYSDAPRLEWNDVDGAAGYRISIRNLVTNELVVDNKWTTSTYYKLDGRLDAAAAEYRIWVGAMRSKSDTSSSSFTSSTITIHTKPEAPEIEDETWKETTYDSVVLSMEITRNNGNAITDSGFYIVESGLPTSEAVKYSFKKYGSYSATSKGYKEMTITGLKPDTKYQFWAYAVNGVGETETASHFFRTDEYECPHNSGVYTNNYPDSICYVDINDSKQHEEIWYYHQYCNYCDEVVEKKSVKETYYNDHQFEDGVCTLCKYEKTGGAKFGQKPTLSLSISGNNISGDIYGTYYPGDIIYFQCTANYSDHIFIETNSSKLVFTNASGYEGKSGTFVERSSASTFTPKSYTNGSVFSLAIPVPAGIPAGDYTISVTATDGVYDPNTNGSIAGTSYYDSVKKSLTVRVGSNASAGDGNVDLTDSRFNNMNEDYDYTSSQYYEKLKNVKLTGNYAEDMISIAKSQVGYTEASNNRSVYGLFWGNTNTGTDTASWCAHFVEWCAQLVGIVDDKITPLNSHELFTGAFGSAASPYYMLKDYKFEVWYFYINNNGGLNYSSSSNLSWKTDDNKVHNFTGVTDGNKISEGKKESFTPVRGDLIYFRPSKDPDRWGHVGIVDKVENGYVYFCDGNGQGNGSIISGYNDGVAYRKVSLTNSLITAYARPDYGNTSSPSSHSHTYSEYGFEAEHPHKEYKKCACGAYEYTGKTISMASCNNCFPDNSDYYTQSELEAAVRNGELTDYNIYLAWYHSVFNAEGRDAQLKDYCDTLLYNSFAELYEDEVVRTWLMKVWAKCGNLTEKEFYSSLLYTLLAGQTESGNNSFFEVYESEEVSAGKLIFSLASEVTGIQYDKLSDAFKAIKQAAGTSSAKISEAYKEVAKLAPYKKFFEGLGDTVGVFDYMVTLSQNEKDFQERVSHIMKITEASEKLKNILYEMSIDGSNHDYIQLAAYDLYCAMCEEDYSRRLEQVLKTEAQKQAGYAAKDALLIVVDDIIGSVVPGVALGTSAVDLLFDMSGEGESIAVMIMLGEMSDAIFRAAEKIRVKFVNTPSSDNARDYIVAMDLCHRFMLLTCEYTEDHLYDVFKSGIAKELIKNQDVYTTYMTNLRDSRAKIIEKYNVFYSTPKELFDTCLDELNTRYTICYNANGGIGAPQAHYNTVGITTLTSTVPTYENHIFLGWSESSTATKETYQVGDALPETKDGNITLFAVWQEKDEFSAIPVTGVKLNKSTANMTVGSTVTLTATVSPSDASDLNVNWASSNTAVAKVSSGKVTAVSAGTAVITVTTTDGGYSASCTVIVERNQNAPDNPPVDFTLGDINLDTNVDIRDALRLFQHSMDSTVYPIDYTGNVDFTKDGSIDIKDALRLFQYSMNPDTYPIA